MFIIILHLYTNDEYLLTFLYSLWNRFVQYVSNNVGCDAANALDTPSKTITDYITAWIYIECDIPEPQTGNRMHCQNKTYSHALKMRAAISFHYNELGRGSNSWHQGIDGSWLGNPSLSHAVSRYMLSLQRRKVMHLLSL